MRCMQQPCSSVFVPVAQGQVISPPAWAMQQPVLMTSLPPPVMPAHSLPQMQADYLRSLGAAQAYAQMGGVPQPMAHLQAMHMMSQMGHAQQQEALARHCMMQSEVPRRASRVVVSELPSDGGMGAEPRRPKAGRGPGRGGKVHRGSGPGAGRWGGSFPAAAADGGRCVVRQRAEADGGGEQSGGRRYSTDPQGGCSEL